MFGDSRGRLSAPLIGNFLAGRWEIAMLLAGFFGCTCIGRQVAAEWYSPLPSSLSPGYVLGFLAIYIFAVFYGIRFRRLGIWASNLLAAILQSVLAFIIWMK